MQFFYKIKIIFKTFIYLIFNLKTIIKKKKLETHYNKIESRLP